MNLQQYRKQIADEMIAPIRKASKKQASIEDGTYFERSIKRAGVLNQQQVLPEMMQNSSMEGDHYLGDEEPVAKTLKRGIKPKVMKAGKLNLGKEFEKLGKGADKVGNAIADASIKVNPMMYAINNKKIQCTHVKIWTSDT